MLQVRDGMDPLLRRPFSFHRIHAGEGTVDLLYRVVGRGTMMLSKCRPGDRLNLMGPLGNGFTLPGAGGGAVLVVAGGIGVAPLLELVARLAPALPKAEQGAGVHLFYGARTAAELLPRREFKDLGATVYFSTDDGTYGFNGYVTRLLAETVERERLSPAILYACGPLAMQYHVSRWAIANGVPAELSLESLMACGVGACLGCALPAPSPRGAGFPPERYVHVCKDGPIFPPGAIEWEKIRTLQTQPPIYLFS
jgi:dihydroorotate dehydrogenase electron transfer subunit